MLHKIKFVKKLLSFKVMGVLVNTYVIPTILMNLNNHTHDLLCLLWMQCGRL